MLRKGASTQRHNQQVLAKPRHQPFNRDQQVRKKLQQKAKIKGEHTFNLEKRHYKSYIEHSNQTHRLFFIYQH